MGLNCGIPSLIILLFISVSGTLDVNVSCSPQTICALSESEVDLKCSYSNISIKTVFWFSFKEKAKWRNEEHPEDLALDSDYAGRVYYSPTTNTSSTLTIRELRTRDTGEYLLMIITEKGEKHLSLTTVNLTVADPQVKLNSGTFSQPKETLTCITSCNLTTGPLSYTWNKNGRNMKANQTSLVLSSEDAGSYSCSVASSYVEVHSNAVCVFDQDCWNVTYTDRRVCALEGSSVDFPCTYSHPSGYSINDAFWHSRWFVEEPMDLPQERQFAGRVEFIGVKERNCTLTMKDVKMNDSGEYYFQFITKTKGGRFSGRPGVILNVTGLQVKVISSTASDGTTVTLICSSTCTLPNNPTYMWYKNRQLVTNKLSRNNKLYLKCSEDAGNYSCAVRGHEELRSPDQTLSDCPEESSGSKLVSVGVVVFLALILGIAALWMYWVIRKKRGAERNIDIQTPDPADHTYTALNPTTMTSDYDTLTHFTGSPSDTYTALNSATMCSDYATLTNVTDSHSDIYTALNPATMSSDYDTLAPVRGFSSGSVP
ncbi:obscurin-like isoform X2 [Pygocentrus nattereri]|uniref:Ig-like domain-containing protein n=1 Tax=Pygocentrus nattereri TaxID=42514 RepID=A0A3B4EKZ0_PYGNA|nr:obscurin-like isoform X2 [Pygocentrus nattereri]